MEAGAHGVELSPLRIFNLGVYQHVSCPDWPAFPYIYVHITAVDPTVRVRRYRATGALSDPAGTIGLTEPYEILITPNNNPSHNGGSLEFGLDDLLYVSLGDDKDECSAQDSTSLQGVICRLNVLNLPPGAGGPPPRADLVPVDNPFVGSGGDEELVFCFGLRNPFRFSVHPQSGNLIIGDVDQHSYEEINEAWGGENFGWPFREGLYIRPSSYNGAFFFSDYIQAFVRVLVPDGGAWAPMDSVPGQPNAEDWGTINMFVSDWEVGPDGALYYLLQYSNGYASSSAELHRIV